MKTKKSTFKLISLIAGSTLLTILSVNSINAQTEPAPLGKSQHTMHHPQTSGDATTQGMKMMGKQDMDQHFLMMMVEHYQTEVDMAELALKKTENPALKTLAQSIQSQQNQTIQDMKDWYKNWYKTDLSASNQMSMNHEMPMQSGMDMNHEMPMQSGMNMNHEMPMQSGMGMDHKMPMQSGMSMNHEMPMQSCMEMMGSMMNFDLATLENADDFDQAFIAQMMRIQKMDVMMAAMVLDSSHPELRDLAQSIIQTKSMAIEQLQSL